MLKAIKSLRIYAIIMTVVLGFGITACSFGLDPDKFEVELHSEYSPGILRDYQYTKLTIRSLSSDPISLSNVTVNEGRCQYGGRYRGSKINLPAHFQMGQSLTLYLNCSYDAIVKVDLETDQGDASYRFK